MLLEFKTKNYKSFVEEARLSMVAAPKQRDLEFSLLNEKVAGIEHKGLCSSVIYGPNASGKTNIIGAIETLRSIVLRGNIRNTEDNPTLNIAASILELIPNSSLSKPEPVCFSIDFTADGTGTKYIIRYELKIDLGVFLDNNYPRKIVYESLLVNDSVVFLRQNDGTDSIRLENPDVIKNYLMDTAQADISDIAIKSLISDELFLTGGFKFIISPAFVQIVTDWFRNKLSVVYRSDVVAVRGQGPDPKKNPVIVEKTINDAAKLFGLNANAVAYVSKEDESGVELKSIIQNRERKKTFEITSNIFESYGTVRFINIFPLVLTALKNGGVLVIDEFDASIEFSVLMSIINAFHNNDINTKHAQLIFNTHNPVFLNFNLFRRDEIKFVERSDETHRSDLYSLADFRTAGELGVRRGNNYMKGYMGSKYGAIRDVDLTPVFESLMVQE